jgi:hypothetical protein
MLNRLEDWKRFSELVEGHIVTYTIPQYQSENGELDQIGIWSAIDCISAIRRYCARFGKNARGPEEALRDMLKIAHYAQFAHDKLREELSDES